MKSIYYLIIFIIITSANIYSQDVDIDMDIEDSDFYEGVYPDVSANNPRNIGEDEEKNEAFFKSFLLTLGGMTIKFWDYIIINEIWDMSEFVESTRPYEVKRGSLIRHFFIEDQLALQKKGLEYYRQSLITHYGDNGLQIINNNSITKLTTKQLEALSVAQRQYINKLHKALIEVEDLFSLPREQLSKEAENLLKTIAEENTSKLSKLARRMIGKLSRVFSRGAGTVVLLPLDFAIFNANEVMEENIIKSNRYDRRINPNGLI